jgi:hypothetical protein
VLLDQIKSGILIQTLDGSNLVISACSLPRVVIIACQLLLAMLELMAVIIKGGSSGTVSL